ncbi:MAG TPA: VIT1/CCC1 transporter family protein [Anaerolineales bacterium]|nr:VIT1/CCC1 transporter family protein [Anaerolineales bacterium]
MSISKRLEEARSGYAKKDVKQSSHAHDPARIAQAAREEHGGASHQYLGDMVYGGLDGIITTFAVVSGVAGAALGSGVVVILGLANLFADGFSMATGAYLSTKSDQEYYQREWQREAWEVEHFPEGERAELYEVYLTRGYSEQEAGQLVEIQTREPRRWVKAMMVDELGMMKDERKPQLSALATLVAFILAGSVPLIVYLLGLFTVISPRISFPVSVLLSALALFALGASKVLVTERNPWKSGLEMLLVGSLAAGVAYIVGLLLRGLGG